MEETEMDGGYQSEGERDGSQHSQPPDQLHLPPVCIPRGREQQGCLLHISVWGMRQLGGWRLAWQWPGGQQSCRPLFPAGLQDSCPWEETACLCPLVMCKHLGILPLVSLLPIIFVPASVLMSAFGPDLLFPGLLQWISNFPAAGFRSSNIFC